MSETSEIKWFEQLAEIYRAGIAHAFILHFNVKDNVSSEHPHPPSVHLTQRLSRRKIIATYSIDKGVEFSSRSGELAAKKLLGIDEEAGANLAADNPVLAALQEIEGGEDSDLPRAPAAALRTLDRLLRTNDPDNQVAVIVEEADLLAPDAPSQMLSPEDKTVLAILSRWGNDREIMRIGNPIILISQDLPALNQKLRAASARFEPIEIPLPTLEERKRLIERHRENGLEIDQEEVDLLARQTAALSLLHTEDVILRVKMRGEVSEEAIAERKNTLIKLEFGDVIEFMESPTLLADIGGLEHIKQFFYRSVITPIKRGRKYRVPMGILMLGPPGTGKTMMAQAVANEAGLNAVYLRVGGNIASKWQGEGERNLARALRAIESLAPALVFIDEIDQVVSRGSGEGSNQQNNRIFQRLLEFMGDDSHRGEIIFLAASNRPDRIDDALKRPGRFDKKIPFLPPNEEERASIIDNLARKIFGGLDDLVVTPEIAARTEGWTGAGLQAAVIKAAEIIEDESRVDNTTEAINQALLMATERISPRSGADSQLMAKLAIAECDDKDLLPAEYQAMLDIRDESTAVTTSSEQRGQREI